MKNIFRDNNYAFGGFDMKFENLIAKKKQSARAGVSLLILF